MEKTVNEKQKAKNRTDGVYNAYLETADEEKKKSGTPKRKLIPIEKIQAAISRYNRHINNVNEKFGEWV